MGFGSDILLLDSKRDFFTEPNFRIIFLKILGIFCKFILVWSLNLQTKEYLKNPSKFAAAAPVASAAAPAAKKEEAKKEESEESDDDMGFGLFD